MAGTLTISTLSDGTNSTSATNLVRGACVAWVNFVGTSATINAGYNVSSITRLSAGQYEVNFTNALADANYSAILGMVPGSAINPSRPMLKIDGSGAYSTTKFSIGTWSPTTTVLVDAPMVTVAVFR